MSKIIGDTACPQCTKNGRDRTGNHLMLFEDGGGYCARCGYVEHKGTFTKPSVTITGNKSKEEIEKEITWVEDNSVIRGLKDRGIKSFVCEHYGVRVGLSFNDGTTPVCTYLPVSDGQGVQGYRGKNEDKVMWMKGNGKDAHFFGAHIVAKRGKRLFVTEGHEDCLAVYQAIYEFMDEKWRKNINVVSLQNGAGSAAQEFVRNAELIRGYKEIVLCFDNDEAGQKAVEAVTRVLPKDKVKIAKFELKDANEMVKAGKSKELYFDLMQPVSPRPEKIVCGIDIDDIIKPLKKGIMCPYPGLNEKLHGFRYGEGGGELTVICAGSGMGKTTLAREIAYDFNANHELRLFNVWLEEQKRKTGQSYIALDNNIPLPVFREDPLGSLPLEVIQASADRLVNNGRCFFFNHWGSLQSDLLMDHMYHAREVEKCDFGLLDHISLVVSGEDSSSEGERKDLDILMTKLAAFTENSGMSVIAIVHLKRPPNGSFNDGKQISLNQLRGSAAIEQLAHNIIAVEGSQHGSRPNERIVRVLKNREWGSLGIADRLNYVPETGRLLPTVQRNTSIRG